MLFFHEEEEKNFFPLEVEDYEHCSAVPVWLPTVSIETKKGSVKTEGRNTVYEESMS